MSRLVETGARVARRLLPAPLRRAIAARLHPSAPPPGRIDMGDLARVAPVDGNFGYGRGQPVDRFYIEQFLARHAADISGRVLEVGDAAYSRRFGTGITQQDVLSIAAGHPDTTIVGDLTEPGVLPAEAFDCLVVTQTLQFIYDVRAAVEQLHRALKPGGVLLLTVPGVSSVDPGGWGKTWYWALTGLAAKRLVGDAFGDANVSVGVRGNVYAATCFLHGLALEEVRRDWLLRDDPAYPVVVCVRARRDG